MGTDSMIFRVILVYLRGDADETDLRIPPACSNGRDDDRDGLVDYGEDPDCDFAGDRTE